MYVIECGTYWPFDLEGRFLCHILDLLLTRKYGRLWQSIISPFGYGRLSVRQSFLGMTVIRPKHIYNPILTMMFLVIFTFYLDNTKR